MTTTLVPEAGAAQALRRPGSDRIPPRGGIFHVRTTRSGRRPLISKTAKYAVRAVVYLTARAREGQARVPIQDVAAALSVPQNYLSKVMHQLGRAGVLDSVRGPHGGFALAVPPEELVLARITAPFDDTGGPLPCLLKDRPCNPEQPCVAHHRWKQIATETRAFFETTTVTELLDGAAARAPLSI